MIITEGGFCTTVADIIHVKNKNIYYKNQKKKTFKSWNNKILGDIFF